MKKQVQFLSVLTLCVAGFSQANAQNTTCDSTSNIIIYSNYDGGILNLNIDQNIPNLMIGVCSYEAVQINISGTYASNVTKVWYAGYIGTNDNCNLGVTNTTISGVPNNVDTIQQYPLVTMTDANGSPNMVCAYQCASGNQGGCNTPEQVAHFFMTKFGGTTVRFHRTQYGCWPSQAVPISTAGNCCLIPVMTNTSEMAAGEITNVFPNPAADEINISYAAKKSGEAKLVLTDLLGREVIAQSFVSNPGELFFRLDISEIPNGIYLLQIKTTEGIVTKKIEIQ